MLATDATYGPLRFVTIECSSSPRVTGGRWLVPFCSTLLMTLNVATHCLQLRDGALPGEGSEQFSSPAHYLQWCTSGYPNQTSSFSP